MKGHVEGSICLLIPGTRALLIKMLVDLNWGTAETRGRKSVCTSACVREYKREARADFFLCIYCVLPKSRLL